MKLNEILKILEKAEVLYGEEFLDKEFDHCFASDLMSDVLALAKPKTLLITGLVTPQAVRTADMVDCAGILFVRGKEVPDETIKAAKEIKLPILKTKDIMYVSSGKIYEKGIKE